MRVPTANRQSGSLLFEIVLALTILTVGIFAYLGAFFSNYRAIRTMNEMDAVSNALRNVAEHLTGIPLEDVYANYHGRTIEVPDLEGVDGQPAAVTIVCHVNESQIPPAFGPVEDIDGNPGNRVADASATYRILPIQLTLTYGTAFGPQTEEVFLILGAD